MRPLLALVALLALVVAARADQLAAGLSTDDIRITSSFRGASVVLFGALAVPSRLGELKDRDIVVVLRGPDVPILVRRKARVVGIYTNVEEVRIAALPTYYHLASTRPLAEIASGATLSTLHIGSEYLAATITPQIALEEAEAFRAAAVRVKTRARLYDEEPGGVKLMGSYLFRARMRLPANVIPGRYRADVYLFGKGKLIAHVSTTLPIYKAGLERRLADYAQHMPLSYGAAVVAIALGLGWLGFIAFRRR